MEFEMHNFSTWSENERRTYHVGHREGAACRDQDWSHALEDVLPDHNMEITPTTVKEYIEYLQNNVTADLK